MDDIRPGIEVADSDLPRWPATRIKATIETRDIWQAAFLDMEGIEFLAADVDAQGRCHWIFVNHHDAGWQKALEFRAGVSVDVEMFRQAYKRMGSVANEARKVRSDGYTSE